MSDTNSYRIISRDDMQERVIYLNLQNGGKSSQE